LSRHGVPFRVGEAILTALAHGIKGGALSISSRRQQVDLVERQEGLHLPAHEAGLKIATKHSNEEAPKARYSWRLR
jgi:hypothetical protein